MKQSYYGECAYLLSILRNVQVSNLLQSIWEVRAFTLQFPLTIHYNSKPEAGTRQCFLLLFVT